MLQIGQNSVALRLAIESGDPNIIEKVFKKMLRADFGEVPKEQYVRVVIEEARAI